MPDRGDGAEETAVSRVGAPAMRTPSCAAAALTLAALSSCQTPPRTVETCSALVRVVDPSGGPVSEYDLQILGAGLRHDEVRPSALRGDRYLIEHLPAGELRLRSGAADAEETTASRVGARAMRSFPCAAAALALAAALAAQTPSKTVETCSVFVRVVDAHGGPVSRYDLQVLGPGVTRREVEPRALRGDEYLLEHLPIAELALRIDALGFARTVSARFQTAEGRIPEVTVTMTRGGCIEGRVLDADGRPLANAAVHTDPLIDVKDGEQSPMAPLVLILATTSSATQRTDGQGRYRLELLAPGAYSVCIHDPAFCDCRLRALAVTVGGVTKAPDVRLARGAVLEGTVAMPPNAPFVRVEVIAVGTDGRRESITHVDSDESGRFRLPERVPPGEYEVWTSRSNGPDSTELFIISPLPVGIAKLTVLPGQALMPVELDLPATVPRH
jgi:hypothetical protein